MFGARSEKLARGFGSAFLGRGPTGSWKHDFLLTRQLLQCATRRGARFAQRRMQTGSVAHRLCSVSCGLKDLFTLKKARLSFQWCNFISLWDFFYYSFGIDFWCREICCVGNLTAMNVMLFFCQFIYLYLMRTTRWGQLN